MTRRLLTVGLLLAVAFSLSACGRKGKLIPPEGSTYPHHYPNVIFPDGKNGPNGDENTQKDAEAW